MPQSFHRTLRFELDHGAFGYKGYDTGGAELDRFLHQIVHALSAHDSCHEGNVKVRLCRAGGDSAHANGYAVTRDLFDTGRVAGATSVEQGEWCSAAQTQHGRNVAGSALVEIDQRVRLQGLVDKDVGNAQSLTGAGLSRPPPIARSVAVVIRFERPVRGYANVLRLLCAQTRQLGIYSLQMKPCHFLVEVLGQHVDAVLVGLTVPHSSI